MSVTQRLLTADDLAAMPETPGRILELVDGEVIALPGANELHMRIVVLLYKLIDGFVEQHNLGIAMPDGLAYVLRRNPDLVRIPDVSFVAWEDVPGDEIQERFWEGPPTLAVEVVSPHDSANDVHAKVQGYLAAGARQVWVLWPHQRAITVYYPDGSARELGPDAELDGGETLPGFRVRVSALFDVRRRRPGPLD